MWRNVSFVERVEVDFQGNLYCQALVLGDVDNDQGNELVVGSINGDLAIFKGIATTPWRRATDLKMLTCLGIGDICNRKKNNLVCLSVEGWCYIFDIKPDSPATEQETADDADIDHRILKPASMQHLPANGKVMLMADIDGDGLTELVVGYADRIVRAYRWQAGTEGEPYDYNAGHIIQLQQWQLEAQIGSITLKTNAAGKPELIASQPGGTFVTLIVKCEPSTPDTNKPDSWEESNIVFHPLGSKRARNKDVTTVILGGIGRGSTDRKSEYCALATLDGTLMLIDDDRIMWSLQVDHQLFSLSKLDVTGNGKEEVVCCSWDGHTYIVNHSREVVRYNFGESVAVFCSGFFALSEHEKSVPCFVYATFKNRIYIYYNISLPRVESASLLEVMDRIDETEVLLRKLNIDPSRKDQLRELYHWCLYGWHNKT